MLVYALQIALVATVYSVILIQPGMLLGNAYQRLQDWTLATYNKYPEQVWYLKPLISCTLCVAGQWCLWGYVYIVITKSLPYNLFEHLFFISAGIMAAAVFRKIYLWSKI